MRIRILLSVILALFFLTPASSQARTTPDDIYQSKRETFQNSLDRISDPVKRDLAIQGDQLLNTINQRVTARFDVDIARLGAIIDELKSREGITETVVAYGQGETPLDNAAYYLNYAAEAAAYQKAQDYTPQIGGNLKGAFNISMGNLSGNLRTLQGKILKAKGEVKKALDYYEK